MEPFRSCSAHAGAPSPFLGSSRQLPPDVPDSRLLVIEPFVVEGVEELLHFVLYVPCGVV